MHYIDLAITSPVAGPRPTPAPNGGPIPGMPDGGPPPPLDWAQAWNQLMQARRSARPAPSWWIAKTTFRGGVSSWGQSTGEPADESRPGVPDGQGVCLLLTLAGCGQCTPEGEPPQLLKPGRASLSILPGKDRFDLPPSSPGWTYAWLACHHPYVSARIAQQVALTGRAIDFPPDAPLTASLLRLVRGATRKDFRDPFEAEMALFEFALMLERFVQESLDGVSEGRRLIDDVRSRVLASLPQPLDVNGLAAEFGLSRSYFSQRFREKTGLLPSYFATEVRVQAAARRLMDSDAPLKAIARDCGFADSRHFHKVFLRFRHLSPQAFRQACRSARVEAAPSP